MAEFGDKLPQRRPDLKFLGPAKHVKLDESDDLPPRCVCLGPTVGNLNVDIHSLSHSASNWKRGIIKRCAHLQTLNEKSPYVTEFYQFVADKIREYPVIPAGIPYDEMMEYWLSNSRYNMKQRDKMRKCSEQVRKREVSLRKILAVSSFIKSEFYQVEAGKLKECRIINSRSDWFKAFIGPYIKQVEKIVYDDHFIKHKTPKEIAATMEDTAVGYDLFYETDYSSFEGSYTLDFMKHVELKLFKRVLHNYPEAISMIERSYDTNNLRFKNTGHTCKFDGSRMSGEMWTSLANGFTNMMLVKFMLYKSDSIGKFLVEGDDGFIACTRPLKFEIVKELGFQLKIEETMDHRDVKFCSLSTCDGTIVPDIRRVLSHYGAINDLQIADLYRRNSKRGNRQLRQLMKSKAHSLLATSAGIPILQSIALQQLRCYNDDILNPKYFDYWENEFYDLMANQRAKPITNNMRLFVEHNFNIPISVQLALESEIEKCTSPNYHINL